MKLCCRFLVLCSLMLFFLVFFLCFGFGVRAAGRLPAPSRPFQEYPLPLTSLYAPVDCLLISSRLVQEFLQPVTLCASFSLLVLIVNRQMPCCKCANDRACERCSCVKNDKPCVDCYPRRESHCRNPHNLTLVVTSQLATSESPSASCFVSQARVSSTRVTRSHASSQPTALAGIGQSCQRQPSSLSQPVLSSTKDRGESSPVSSPQSSVVSSSQPTPLVHGACSSAGGTAGKPVCTGDNLSQHHRTGGESSLEQSCRPSSSDLCASYNIVMKWRRKLFIVPYGAAGVDFVDEISHIIQSFVDGGSMRNTAWRAFAVLCHVLLQKPHDSRIMANHSEHLRRRLRLWRDGSIRELLEPLLLESPRACIQAHLPPRQAGEAFSTEPSDSTFCNLVLTDRIHSAARYLNPDSSSGVLSLTDVADPVTGQTVHDALLAKHPRAAEPPAHVLLPGEPEAINPILYQRITLELIRRVSRQMHGASGPSGLHAEAWTRLLTSYKASSDRLCSALAAVARCICAESLAKEAMEGFTSARLIPLDKHPGVRPIAVDKLREIGPGYGYFPNAKKTVLLTKPQHMQSAMELFGGTGVAITSEGSRYLGGYLGTAASSEDYATSMAGHWTTELRRLADMARTQPQASYTVLTKCLVGRWTYHLRCLAFDPRCLQKIDDCIRTELLPALTGHEVPQDSQLRELLSFPARFGGLAVPALSAAALFERQASLRVTKPLVDLTVRSGDITGSDQQVGGDEQVGMSSAVKVVFGPSMPVSNDGNSTAIVNNDHTDGVASAVSQDDPVVATVSQVRANARARRRDKADAINTQLESIRPALSDTQQQLVALAGEKGVSSWLTNSPSAKQPVTVLSKSDFRDAVAIRYGLPLDGLPTTCVCGATMTTDHAHICPCGGYPIARHNEVRDVLAGAVSEAVRDVDTEPVLLPYDGEDLPGRSAPKKLVSTSGLRASGRGSRMLFLMFGSLTRKRPCCLYQKFSASSNTMSR